MVIPTDLKILKILCNKGDKEEINVLAITKNIGSISSYSFILSRIRLLEKKGIVRTKKEGREIKIHLVSKDICKSIKLLFEGDVDGKEEEKEEDKKNNKKEE